MAFFIIALLDCCPKNPITKNEDKGNPKKVLDNSIEINKDNDNVLTKDSTGNSLSSKPKKKKKKKRKQKTGKQKTSKYNFDEDSLENNITIRRSKDNSIKGLANKVYRSAESYIPISKDDATKFLQDLKELEKETNVEKILSLKAKYKVTNGHEELFSKASQKIANIIKPELIKLSSKGELTDDNILIPIFNLHLTKFSKENLIRNILLKLKEISNVFKLRKVLNKSNEYFSLFDSTISILFLKQIKSNPSIEKITDVVNSQAFKSITNRKKVEILLEAKELKIFDLEKITNNKILKNLDSAIQSISTKIDTIKNTSNASKNNLDNLIKEIRDAITIKVSNLEEETNENK